jgi:hypothetical protein
VRQPAVGQYAVGVACAAGGAVAVRVVADDGVGVDVAGAGVALDVWVRSAVSAAVAGAVVALRVAVGVGFGTNVDVVPGTGVVRAQPTTNATTMSHWAQRLKSEKFIASSQKPVVRGRARFHNTESEMRQNSREANQARSHYARRIVLNVTTQDKH